MSLMIPAATTKATTKKNTKSRNRNNSEIREITATILT